MADFTRTALALKLLLVEVSIDDGNGKAPEARALLTNALVGLFIDQSELTGNSESSAYPGDDGAIPRDLIGIFGVHNIKHFLENVDELGE